MTGAQTLALADPRVVEEAAMHECPTCYFATREARVVIGEAWPIRTRYESKVEKPCETCGVKTIWCSAGEWRSAPSKKQAVR